VVFSRFPVAFDVVPIVSINVHMVSIVRFQFRVLKLLDHKGQNPAMRIEIICVQGADDVSSGECDPLVEGASYIPLSFSETSTSLVLRNVLAIDVVSSLEAPSTTMCWVG
jgi:hypothetical protein